jgi:hypothetical protein
MSSSQLGMVPHPPRLLVSRPELGSTRTMDIMTTQRAVQLAVLAVVLLLVLIQQYF